VWSEGFDFSWFVGATVAGPTWRSVGAGPVELGSTGESLVLIGDRRLFVWGGLLASHGSEPNRPTPEGAILQLP
jgi:hypothetical protein